jgi:hypothetical protein
MGGEPALGLWGSTCMVLRIVLTVAVRQESTGQQGTLRDLVKANSAKLRRAYE